MSVTIGEQFYGSIRLAGNAFFNELLPGIDISRRWYLRGVHYHPKADGDVTLVQAAQRNAITANSVLAEAPRTEVTTEGAHDLAIGDTVRIRNSNSTPTIDGEHVVASQGFSATTYQIAINVTIAGTQGEQLARPEDVGGVQSPGKAGTRHALRVGDGEALVAPLGLGNGLWVQSDALALEGGGAVAAEKAR